MKLPPDTTIGDGNGDVTVDCCLLAVRWRGHICHLAGKPVLFALARKLIERPGRFIHWSELAPDVVEGEPSEHVRFRVNLFRLRKELRDCSMGPVAARLVSSRGGSYSLLRCNNF